MANQNDLIQQLNEELADATELFDQMRDFMPSMPSSEYLKQMQEISAKIEKLNSRISQISSEKSSSAKTNPSISKYKISPLQQPLNGTVAVCTATFYNTLTVNGITINHGKHGLYVKMPQKRTHQGRYLDVAHPLSESGRRNINETLLNGYHKNEFQKEFYVNPPNRIFAQNSVKYPPEFGNSLARLDVVVGDMVVHNAKIVQGKDGAPHLFMPNYKTKDGSYTSICNPSNKAAYAEMSKQAMAEYNTNYSFRKLSDDDVAALRESGIKLQCRKNSQGENVVKFKFEDLAKVNAVVNPTPTAAPKIQ